MQVGWPGEEAKAHIEAQLPAGSLVIVIAEDMWVKVGGGVGTRCGCKAGAATGARRAANLPVLFSPNSPSFCHHAVWGRMMTMDYRVDRVRIIVGRETGRVVAPPRIG